MTYHQQGHHAKENKEGSMTSSSLWRMASLPLSKGCCLWRGSQWCCGQTLSPWDQCPVTCLVIAPRDWAAGGSSNQNTKGQGSRHGAEPNAEGFWPTPWDSGSVGLGWNPGSCVLSKVEGQCQYPAWLRNLWSREHRETLLSLIFSFPRGFFLLFVSTRKRRVGKEDSEESKAKWRAF